MGCPDFLQFFTPLPPFYVHLMAQRLDKITEEMLDIGAVSGVADSYGE